MKYLPLILAAVLVALAVLPQSSCKTDDQGHTVPDWAVIDTEIDLLVEDLDVAAVNFPQHAEDYLALKENLIRIDIVVEALEAGNVAADARGAIDAAMVILDQFPGEEWAFAAGALLRRVRAYLPAE